MAAPATTLRPATTADSLLIADLHTRSRAVTYRGLLPDAYLGEQMPQHSGAEWTAKMATLAAGAGAVLIAEQAGDTGIEAIGFVCMLAPDAQGSVLIDNLHLRPDRKGGGVGTLLLNAAHRWALDQGATRLHLLVIDANTAAIGFYESRGWQLAERRADTMGGTPIVALVYVLSLTPSAGR